MSILKKTATIASLVAIFAGTAAAEEVQFTACTKDGRTAMLVADINGGIENGKTMKELVDTAFKETASQFHEADLAREDSFDVFSNNLYKGLGDSVTTPDSRVNILKLHLHHQRLKGVSVTTPDSRVNLLGHPTIQDKSCTAEAQQHEDERLAIAANLKEERLGRARDEDRRAGRIAGLVIKDCASCPDMVVIPSGEFEMGSGNGSSDEKPVHSVVVNAFALGKTEVTQGQWRAVMGRNPSYFSSCGDDCPVEKVSWKYAQIFIHKLNAKTGKQYRLPSEAEWEYACRSGGQHEYCGSDNVDSVAWYESNSGEKTNLVSRKQPNAFGLYDMSGNVWEWVEDGWHDSYNGAPTNGSVWQGDGAKRVLRGGSWIDKPQFARAALRYRAEPAYRFSGIGFRVARMLP